jgi:ABC-2 type transport system permease protein
MMYALFRHEIYTVVSNKRYMLSLAVQLALIFAILPVFSTFLSTGAVSILTPALNEFVPLGIVDESPNSNGLRDALESNKKLDLIYLQGYDSRILENGQVAAILVIPGSYDESSNRVLDVQLFTDESNMKAGAVYDAVLPSISQTSTMLTEKRKTEFAVSISDPLKVKKELLKPIVLEAGEQRYSSFFLSYLIPLMLFFPIFTVGSIILDSVVGERERKTVESLLVSPIYRDEVIISKFLSASFFVAFQIVLWLLIFGFYGFPIQSKLLIFLVVLIIDSAIISTALLFAYYSRTVKEANILIMLLYTSIFIGLIISLSINYFDTSIISTPFTIISDLVVGEDTSVLFWPIALIFYTSLALVTNIGLLERDDIVFGPRPGLFDLLSDLALWLFSLGRTGYLLLTFVFSAFAILYASIVEIALGMFIFFTFGFTNLIVPLFALVEEAIKPVGVYILSAKRDLKKTEAITLGVLSGIAFFALESLFFAIATYYFFPARILAILKLRIATTMVIHAITSGIVGYGITRKENFAFYLLLATLIHSVFNLVTTGGFL